MSAKKNRIATTLVAENPLEGEQLLLDALFGQRQAGASTAGLTPLAPVRAQRAASPKPQHYKIISISMYNEDIERLEELVRQLKSRGHHKANKSQLIRAALAQLDLDRVPKEP